MAPVDMYAKAPRKVRLGRVLLILGSILFFVAAFFLLAEFILAFFPTEEFPSDWNDPSFVFEVVKDPFLVIFYVVAGIGGLCYAFDKYRMKVFASLAGVIMLVVIVIGTVIMFRNLIKNCLVPNANVGRAFLDFFLDFLSIQLTGGIYFIGWFMCKDYTGD